MIYRRARKPAGLSAWMDGFGLRGTGGKKNGAAKGAAARRIFAALLVLLTAVVLQLLGGAILGFWVNFALAALVASAFFLGFFELLALILLAVLLLNWQPEFSWELLFVAAPAIIAFKLKDALPWKPWISCFIVVFSAIVVTYLVFAPAVVLGAPRLFAADLIGSLVFAQAAFLAIEASSGR